jgi:YVTN family beta-propeller protein
MRPTTILTLAAGALLCALWPALAAEPPAPARLGPGGTRGPVALAFRTDGHELYVAEQDEGRVAVLDPETGQTLGQIDSGGTQPVALATAPGGRLVVANRFSGSLGILDAAGRALTAAVTLPGGPAGVVVTPAGEAFVSLSQLDEVAVVGLAAAEVIARIPLVAADGPLLGRRVTTVSTGRRPGALALAPDGRTVVCATSGGGALWLIDATARRVSACLPLPAVNLRGVAVTADGARALVTGQQPNPDFSTARPEETWKNLLYVVRLAGAESRLEATVELDQPGDGAADPGAVAVAGSGGPVFVTLGGAHSLASLSLPGAADSTPGPQRLAVGAGPRGIALQPGTGEVWVANELGNSLSVLSPAGGPGARTVELALPTRPDRRLRGRLLFTSAQLTRGGRFTCNSCHPDGNSDGLAWRFAHLQDGIERRNSRSLRGAVLLTAPYRWAPREQDFETFVNDEIEGLLGHPKLPHSQLHALWDLANEFPLPPNPFRPGNGALTAAAQRGKALFSGKAGCRSCHGGEQFGGTGKSAWIGTTPKGLRLDIPHLTGVYDTAPYLHDARADTLEAIFSRHDPGQLHGKAHLLTDVERQDLLRFVREL